MKFRTMLMASAMAASVVGFAGAASAADIKEVQMLHWWTSGGEAAALNVLKQDLAKEGYAWKDVPVAGGGGEGAMTALKAMVAAGNPPTASQILGYFAIDYAEAGKLGDITSLATKEDWAKVVPKALQKFTTTERQMGRRSGQHPFGQLDLAQQGGDGQDRRNRAEDLRRVRRAARQGQGGRRHSARARRPALAGSDDVRTRSSPSTGGIDFYKKAFVDLDESALKSDTMKKAFDNLAKLRAYTDPNYAGRDWNLATAMVIKGDALVQVMGDWAKGEFKAANKEAGKDFLCYRFPGTDGDVIYNTDMFAMFKVPADRKAAPARARRRDDEHQLPVGVQRRQGLGARAHGRSGHRFRHVRQEGHRRREGGERGRHVRRLDGAELRAAAGDRRAPIMTS